jgi:hypothetical protein
LHSWKFFPKPVEIIEAINGGSAKDFGLIAWPKALNLLSDYWFKYMVTLIPDGAAGWAIKAMMKSKIPYNVMRFYKDTFLVHYLHYFQQYFYKPTIVTGPLEIDACGEYFAHEKVLFEEWWPPEVKSKFAKELDAFDKLQLLPTRNKSLNQLSQKKNQINDILSPLIEKMHI